MNNVKLKKLLNISIRICIVFLLCFCIACSKQGLNRKIFTDIVEKNDFVVTDISASGDKSGLTLLAVEIIIKYIIMNLLIKMQLKNNISY